MRFGIELEHLGPDATEADVTRMIELLTADGWDVSAGTHPSAANRTDAEWDEVMAFDRA